MKKLFFLTILFTSTLFYNAVSQVGVNDIECTSCIKTEPNGEGASALGIYSKAYGDYSFAGGKSSTSPGLYSFSFGLSATASNEASIALGYQSEATGIASFASGYVSKANGDYSTAIGVEAHANGYRSMSIGSYTIANTTDAFAFGAQVKATNSKSFVIGTGAGLNYLENSNPNSLKIGFGSTKHTFFMGTATATDKTGKIGIGDVLSPEAKLHIRADDNEDASLYLQPTGTYKYGKLFIGDKQNFISAKTEGNMIFETITGRDFAFTYGNIIHDAGLYVATSQIKAPDESGLILSDQNGEGITIIEGGYTSIGTLATSNYRLAIGGDLLATGQITSTSLKSNQIEAYNTAGLMLTNQNGSGIFIDDDGNVGIGTINALTGYKLAVNGKILSEEVKIIIDVGADFVFADNYYLPKLEDVEKYIEENNHLPEIPSAEEMKTNGLEIGEMQIKLLQKVEELTLYMIKQQKTINKQQKEIDELKKKMDTGQ